MQKRVKGDTFGNTRITNYFFCLTPCECREAKIRPKKIVCVVFINPKSPLISSVLKSMDVEKYEIRGQMILELEALQLKISRLLSE